MDPQTGHHNLDIPLTVFDVEKIEINKQADSSRYGAGAFAGSINIVTKKPKKKTFSLEAFFGEHALSSQAASLGYLQNDISARISFEHKISKAARPNTDFEYQTASFYLNKEIPNGNIDTQFGYQKKDFGADSFYSNLFPEEEEHTQTFFYRLGMENRLEPYLLKNSIFLRRHRDKFILNRNNPTSVNYHTTYIYGLNSEFNIQAELGKIILGIDAGQDQINSTNLNKHARLFEAAQCAFIPDLPDRLSLEANLRLDCYQRWHEQESYSIDFGYWMVNEKLKLNSSLAHAFRIPSFTELYYSDAANKGNSELKIERSDNFRLGLYLKAKAIDFSLDGFLRRGNNLIDWTRSSTQEAWQATNLGKTDFKGLEFRVGLTAPLNYKLAKLKKISFSYNYTEADKKQGANFSKYALDILRHQYLLDIGLNIFGLDFSWNLSYNQRQYGEVYFLGNLYIGKKIGGRNFVVEPFVKVDNFTNTKYTEVAGVLMPGRWIKSGIKFEW
jgi:iron complex outermembrane receptor protein